MKTRGLGLCLLLLGCGEGSGDDQAVATTGGPTTSPVDEGAETHGPVTGEPGSSSGVDPDDESSGSSGDPVDPTGGPIDPPGGGACPPATGEGIDIEPNTWVQVSPSFDLPAGGSFHERGYTSMAYSACAGAVVSFEGYIDDEQWFPTIYSNALYTYDSAARHVDLLKLNNWSRQGDTIPLPANADDPTPPDRHPYGCIADAPERGGFFIWGGANQSLASGHPTDTWRYDVETESWEELHPSSAPPVMLEAAMAYHAAADTLLLHGNPQGGEGRTFTYDFVADSWEEVDSGPGTKSGSRMLYDAQREEVVLFGGGPFAVGGNELWTWNPGDGWSQHQPDNPPDFRKRHGFVHDTVADVYVVFGGSNPSAGADLRDTWIYDPDANTWTEANPAEPPPPVGHVDMAYDAVGNVVVARLNETWWHFRCATR